MEPDLVAVAQVDQADALGGAADDADGVGVDAQIWPCWVISIS